MITINSVRYIKSYAAFYASIEVYLISDVLGTGFISAIR
jgi:hypothetical protein